MNKYELALVVSAKLEENDRAAVVDRAKELITRFGGQTGEVEEWGRRRLAYEIQKQTEAYYYFIQFEAEGTTPNEVEQRMRIMENVLRYLIVSKDENDTFKVTPEPEAVVEEVAEEAAAAEAAVEEVAEEAAAAEAAVEEVAEEAAAAEAVVEEVAEEAAEAEAAVEEVAEEAAAAEEAVEETTEE